MLREIIYTLEKPTKLPRTTDEKRLTQRHSLLKFQTTNYKKKFLEVSRGEKTDDILKLECNTGSWKTMEPFQILREKSGLSTLFSSPAHITEPQNKDISNLEGFSRFLNSLHVSSIEKQREAVLQ